MTKFLGVVALAATLLPCCAQAQQQSKFIPAGATTYAPMGWTRFCEDYPTECSTEKKEPVLVVLEEKVWEYLWRINRLINQTLRPLADADHWGRSNPRYVYFGIVEKWDLAEDGYGDCEEYVLLKRQRLIQSGWPRQALLVTVVLDECGEGHAVLTVKTDRGDFILDNVTNQVRLWSDTLYTFRKQQSAKDENIWVSIAPSPQPLMVATLK